MTEKLVQIMAKADLKTDGERFRLSTELNNAHSFSLIIKNLTGKAIPAGTVNVLQGEIEPKTASYLEIGPEASALVSFRSKKEIGLSPVPVRIKVADKEFNLSVQGVMVPHVPANFSITDKSAWKLIPKSTLTSRNNSVRYGKWSGRELDFKADIQMAWNVTGLYFAVTVYKDSFYPPAEGTAASATWRADGLQIAFDTLKNSAPEDIGYKDDDFEYDIAMYRGKPMVYRRLASLAIHDSLTKACGVIDDVKCAIRQEPGKIIYLLAFSPSSVSPFHLKAGESMRASILVNLNNGKKRIGYLQLSPGLGNIKKKPGQFIELFLAK